MVAGDWQPLIPAATIGRPGTPGQCVPRTAIVKALLSTRGGDLVTVLAPAGYGKTTAVNQWDDADPRLFAWLRLDRLDDDPVHLLLHVATALDRVRPLDRAALRYLRGPGRNPLTQLVPALVGALEECEPLVLVIDDVHEVSAPPARDVLAALITEAPISLTVVLVGRHVPAVHAARRRLGGKLVEVDITDLALSEDEATQVFSGLGGRCDDAVCSSVLDRCEGWAAAVALVALATRDGADPVALTGSHPLLADYLLEEVLGQFDPATVTFLTESAVLERFSGAALDEVLARTDSARRLEQIRGSGNLFVISLDAEGVWYRHHSLLGDFLRHRLHSTDPARLRVLAGRAARMLDRQGDLDAAMECALRAGDRRYAAALVGREAVRLGFDGRGGLLARRVGMLDERTVTEHPDAAIASAWLAVTTGDAASIQRSLMWAARADRGAALADGTPSVEVAVALLSSLVGTGGVHDVVRHAETVRAAGDCTVNPWWGAATVMLGAAESMLGNADRARVLLESTLPLLDELPGFQAAALSHLALLDLGEGDEAGCVARGTAARVIADAYDLSDVVPLIVTYGVSALIEARTGKVTAARESIVLTERLLGKLGNLAARTALLGHGLLAWSAAVLGDREVMTRHLEEGDRAGRREPAAVALLRRLERVRVLAVGGDRKPLTAAELRLLPYLATHLSLQRIAEELMIGRETVKSQATAIYRKLAVASRAEAVAEARRVGLLAS
ncbi:LuxR C-terminal-related transcriptional regulator [Mycolicibacterium sp.]|uniref:LuxR C-terminal-related transcriptional regulator n=1 Tax=Mycolicibacterium sp. TaxID=2320850 RepID=UPI00355D4E5B